VLLRNDVEETPELLQEIANYDQTLPATLRREGMRRALEAQGIAAAAAARAVAAAAVAAAATGEGADSRDPAVQAAAAAAVAAAAAAAAKGNMPVLDGQVQFLPAAASTRSLPGFGAKTIRRLAAKPRGRPRKHKAAGGRLHPSVWYMHQHTSRSHSVESWLRLSGALACIKCTSCLCVKLCLRSQLLLLAAA
jgi:hypothetical protein